MKFCVQINNIYNQCDDGREHVYFISMNVIISFECIEISPSPKTGKPEYRDKIQDY